MRCTACICWHTLDTMLIVISLSADKCVPPLCGRVYLPFSTVFSSSTLLHSVPAPMPVQLPQCPPTHSPPPSSFPPSHPPTLPPFLPPSSLSLSLTLSLSLSLSLSLFIYSGVSLYIYIIYIYIFRGLIRGSDDANTRRDGRRHA